MAVSYNRVILAGNLTREPELKYLPGKTACVNTGLAVNGRRKSGDSWVEETTFVDIAVFGRTAQVMNEYLEKGAPVLVEGRLKYDTWETDGQKRSKLSVICDRMQMLPRGNQNGNGQKPETDATYSEPVAAAAGSDVSATDAATTGDEDIPF